MGVKYTKPRGTADILPNDSGKWVRLEAELRRIVSLYGFKEIRLPTFESTEVFARGVGDTTDIVGKEMYTFIDKGDRSVTLRPEGTSGVARAVLENGLLGSEAMPLKMYYLQSCFRYEKAQKGRLREFHQLGIECFGTNDAASDVEVISVAVQILRELGLKNVSLEINSIGCKACRSKYHDALRSYFKGNENALCDTCKDRLERNPMRILDCKSADCAAIAANAPIMLDYLCEDCSEHFDKVKAILTALNIEFTVNPTIVRGLDYYSNTVFEFVHKSVGTQGTICGGGRYNGLVDEFAGPHTPAVGFGMGLERLMLALEAENIEPKKDAVPKIYIANIGAAAHITAQRLVTMCRENGIYAVYDVVGRGLKPQMKYADKLCAEYSMVLGDDEVTSGKALLKCMADGTSTEVSLDDEIIKHLN
ncbi:MAG: histidine--tRNA ligase [Oscillospiraceae bacterium]